MKRLLAMLMALALMFTAAAALAEAAEDGAEPEEGSKFETVLLKKGSLIIKEYIDCTLFAKDE